MKNSIIALITEKSRDVADDLPNQKEMPRPYSVPPGYVPPTLGEQFRYVSEGSSQGPTPTSIVTSPESHLKITRSLSPSGAQAALRHPYYKYGYAVAILLGVLGYAAATTTTKHQGQQQQGSEGRHMGPQP
jgi:hypothetical protein